MLFVGINPGVRSAVTGHHFAGHSNRFWKLLYDSRLVPEPITFEDDDRLPAFGYGITNIVARPSPGMNDLRSRGLECAGWEHAAWRACLADAACRGVPPDCGPEPSLEGAYD